MITTSSQSSPSPTLTAHSPYSPHFRSRSHYDGPHRSTRSPHISSTYSRRESPIATTAKQSTATAPSATPKSITSAPTGDSSSALQTPGSSRRMVDVGTQYSPPTESLSSAISKTTIASGKVTANTAPQGAAGKAKRGADTFLAESMPSKETSAATTSTLTGAKRTTADSPVGKVPDEPVPQEVPRPLSPSDSVQKKKVKPEAQAVRLLPLQYEQCDPKDLVILISSMLMELIRYNDAIPLRDGHLTRFHSRAPPAISVIDYLQRLTTHATLSPPILLSMVYYIDRLCALYPAFTISSLTVHRFLITSATVASKGLSDSFWTNKTYARVGGVSLKELALLELEFLWRVEWRIVPRPEVLVDYYRSLVERSDDYEIDVAEDSEPEGQNNGEQKDKG